jgi:hypothetical protein
MEKIDLYVQWLNKNQGATSAILTLAMALLTLVYVAATIYLVYLTNRQLRHAISIEAQRIRPHVVFEILSNGNGAVTASLRNLGQTSACNLRVNTEPELKCLWGGKGAIPVEEREEPMALVDGVIASLAPGRQLEGYVAFWDRFSKRYPELRFVCTLIYDGPDGVHYVEKVLIDLSPLKNLKSLRTKESNNAADSLEKIATSLQRISRGNDSPLVRTISEADYVSRQDEMVAQAAKEIERLKGPQE